MLKLWVRGSHCKSGLLYMQPDACFDQLFYLEEDMETDFTKRVLWECNGKTEILNYATIKKPTGELISPEKICSGAKNVLCMKYIGNEIPDDFKDSEVFEGVSGFIYDILWSGDNCNQYIAEIALEKDLEVKSSRVYQPYSRVDLEGLKVQIMETGDVVTDGEEFLDIVISNNLWDDI